MLAARDRIRPHGHVTPAMTRRMRDDMTCAQLFFRSADLQSADAGTAVFGLSDAQAAQGVAAHSSGDHRIRLPHATGRRGIPSTAVMRLTPPQVRKDAVHVCGAGVVECEPSTNAREAVFAPVVADTSAEFAHPYNDAPEAVDDGLKMLLEDMTQHLVRNRVTDFLIASEDEAFAAMRPICKRLKIVAEPSGAVTLATIQKNPNVLSSLHVGVVITGGNGELDRLPRTHGDAR
ncbi:hypothetical protein [Paracoccus sp. Ld10]|uniref:hypothetical protein n=1 Tax=Paracoccus sp. Ld10 TaxID=649158 RepID=UPI00386C6103